MSSVSKSSSISTKIAQSKIGAVFQPFKVQGIQFRNRILAPPTVNDHADVHGKVTLAIIKHYRSLARQGAGTIIVESAYVTKQGRSHVNQLGISDEEHLEGLGKLAQGVKKEGATIGIRLSHAGAQTSESACGEQPVGPSVLNFGRDFDISREFDQGDVEEIVLNYVHAAERAEEVGMDFVEIIKKGEELAFSNKAKIINIKVPLKVKNYIEENLMKEINHYKTKYKMEFNIISDNILVIPEYKIDLLNKNKKTIKKIENIETIKNNFIKQNYSRKKFINKDFRKSNKFKKKNNYKSKKKNNLDSKKLANY